MSSWRHKVQPTRHRNREENGGGANTESAETNKRTRNNGGDEGSAAAGTSSSSSRRSAAGGDAQRGRQPNQEQQQSERKQYPIGWKIMEELNGKVNAKQLLEGSTELLEHMNREPVFRRMDDIWAEPDKQDVFLRLCLLTARANQEFTRQRTQDFLRRLLRSKLVDKLVKQYFATFRPQHPHVTAIGHSLIGILLLGWQTFPSLMQQPEMTIHTDHIINKMDQATNGEVFPPKETKELLDRLKVLKKQTEERQNEREKSNANSVENIGGRQVYDSSGPPPQDFREIDVSLSSDDILVDNTQVYLRKAKIDGRPYDNDQHYLDVQFRLLREDLVRPLRNGIRQFRMEGDARKSDLYIYRGVRLISTRLQIDDGEILTYAQLNQKDSGRRMHRRFMFGSLVCLSSDAFQQQFLFATVVDRDALDTDKNHKKRRQPEEDQHNVRKGVIGLKFISAMEQPNMYTEYMLVESPVFYESHRHVLLALQNTIAVPFSRYLVQMERDPQIPRYQIGPDPDVPRMFDFTSLLVTPDEHDVTRCRAAQITTHYKAADFGMDDSQFEAFAYTLQSELAIVQGPPGTGKTYLGLKIVQLLFANEQLWAQPQQQPRNAILYPRQQLRSPMLVVCYTNHALDQFLEGIVEFLHTDIIRVGGRSKSTALEKFNLNRMREGGRQYLNGEQRHTFYECSDELKKIVNEMRETKQTLDQTDNNQGWIVQYYQLDTLYMGGPWACSGFFFEDNDSMNTWLTEAQSPKSTEPLMDLQLILKLVREYGLHENWAKAVLIYCAYHKQQDLLYKIFEHQHEFAEQKVMLWIADDNCKQYCKNEFDKWPMLEEIDALSRELELDVEIVANLLYGLKRDQQQQRAEHLASILKHILAIPLHIRRRAAGQIGFAEQEEGQMHAESQQIDNNHATENENAAERQVEEEHEEEEKGDEEHNDEEKKKTCDEEENKEEDDDEQEEEDTYVDKQEENRKLAMDEDADEFLKVEHSKQKEQRFKDWLERTEGIRQLITAIQPMGEVEAAQYHEWQGDLWQLPMLTRWRLYQRWVQEWRAKQVPMQEKLVREYCEAKRRYDELRTQAEVELMKRAKVIGMTTTGAARLQAALRSIKPRIVVVEEAAEVYEQHILTSLTECCEHLILIGDHQQLRPAPEDYRLGKDYHLEISLFERLVLNRFDYRRLSNQHRMRPEISGTLMPHFYANLQDHPSVHEYPNVLGMEKNLYFLNHSHPEDVKEGNDGLAKSHSNVFEAEFAVRLARYLSQQGYEGAKITILCAYSEQLFLIRNFMHQIMPAEPIQKDPKGEEDGPSNDNNRIHVENVDNYQGEECDIIILSLVRSNNAEKKIGFLNIPNRVCVAMSRAKQGFYVLGNFDFLAECCKKSRQAPKLWENIHRSAKERGFLGTALPIECQMHGKKQEIRCAQDFDEKASEGGCDQPCKTRMDCGHTCRKPCHTYDPEHKKIPCMEKCQRKCANELHKCQMLCYQNCGFCAEIVLKELPCGHSKNTRCHLDPIEIVCPEPCRHTLPCGHQCANRCNQLHTQRCRVLMPKRLPCGHEAQMECHQSTESVKCKAKVDKIWPMCGHSVETECWVNPEETLCPHPCQQPLPDCEHPCIGTCGKCRGGRLHVECNMECKRILVCGHECGAKCAQECPPCQQHCETACAHSQCSQVALAGERKKKTRKGNRQQRGKEKGRMCGDPCPPCAEQCTNQCRHRQCTMTCGEKCDVAPCNEPCRRELPCSPKGGLKDGQEGPLPEPHYCIGVCGEECIEDICRICQPEEFEKLRETFLGREDEEDALFLRLKDCGHIFEMQDLDMFVKTKLEGETAEGADQAIVVINCPRCSTPIKRSTRYITVLNERADHIEQVKRKLQGHRSKDRLIVEWGKFKESLSNLEEKRLVHLHAIERQRIHVILDELAMNHTGSTILHDWKSIMDSLGKIQNSEVTAQWINTAENIHRILTGFHEALVRINECHSLKMIVSQRTARNDQGSHYHFAKLHSALAVMVFKPQSLKAFLLDDLTGLMHSLAERKMRTISATSLEQLASELGRHNFLFNVFKWADTMEIERKIDLDMEGQEMLQALLTKVGTEPFAQKRETLESDFKALTAHFNMGGLDGITEQQFIQIKQALSNNITTWYKCPNGHFFGIGNCGQAMQTSQCPDCKADIGGTNHRLLATNAVAHQLNAVHGTQRGAMREDPFEALW